MQTVLNAWATACQRHLRTRLEPPPWTIFYDGRNAWHLNPETARLPAHAPAPTTLTFAGKRLPPLLRVVNDKNLWVPDREALPLKIVAVAMPFAKDQKSVIVIPLPSLYRTVAGADQAKILDELFLGLAIHEFTHTRQLVAAAQRINRLRTKYRLPDSLDDNIVETAFGKNEAYKRFYVKEKEHLSRAVLAANPQDCQREIRQALAISQQRRERFFVGDKNGWAELEDIFLAMEGVAMWTQFQITRDRAPRGEDWLKTLVTLSARHDSWSQEEGLALFLLIDRLAPN
jgi:hypothetical protein